MLMRLYNVQRFYSTFRVSFNMTTPSSSKQDSFAMKAWKRKFNVVDQPPYQPPKHLADIISLVKKTDRTREETEQVITRVNQLSESDAESLSLAMSLDQPLLDGFKLMMTNWDFRCPSCESHRKTAAEGNCMVAWSVCSTCQRQYCNSGCVRERGCGKKQCYKCAANCEACDSKLTATASASEPPAQQGSAKRAKPELQLKLVDGSAEEERLLRSAPTLSKDSAARASILMAKQAFAMQQKFNSIGSDKKAPVAIPATRSQVPQEYFDELEKGGRRQLWFDAMKRDILSVCEQHGAVAQQNTLHIAICLGIHARLQKNWLFEDIADLKWYAKTASITSHKLVARGLVVEKFTTNAQASIFKGMNSVNKFYVDSFTDPMVESFSNAFKPLIGVNGCTLTVYMPKEYKVPLELEVVELSDKPISSLPASSSSSSSSSAAASAAATPMEIESIGSDKKIVPDSGAALAAWQAYFDELVKSGRRELWFDKMKRDILEACKWQARNYMAGTRNELMHIVVFEGLNSGLPNHWLFSDIAKLDAYKTTVKYVGRFKLIARGLVVEKYSKKPSLLKDMTSVNKFYVDGFTDPMKESFARAFEPLIGKNGCMVTFYAPKEYKLPLELEVVELPSKGKPGSPSSSSASSSSAASTTATPMEIESSKKRATPEQVHAMLAAIKTEVLDFCKLAKFRQPDLMHLRVFLDPRRPELDSSWLFEDVLKIEAFKLASVQGNTLVATGLKIEKLPTSQFTGRDVNGIPAFITFIDDVSKPLEFGFRDKAADAGEAQIMVYRPDSSNSSTVKRHDYVWPAQPEEFVEIELAPMEDVSEEPAGDSKDSKAKDKVEYTAFQKWQMRGRTCDICQMVSDKPLPYWDGPYDPEMNGTRMCDPCWLEMKQKIGEIAAPPSAPAPPFPASAPEPKPKASVAETAAKFGLQSNENAKPSTAMSYNCVVCGGAAQFFQRCAARGCSVTWCSYCIQHKEGETHYCAKHGNEAMKAAAVPLASDSDAMEDYE